jgi:hypothetical protein
MACHPHFGNSATPKARFGGGWTTPMALEMVRPPPMSKIEVAETTPKSLIWPKGGFGTNRNFLLFFIFNLF